MPDQAYQTALERIRAAAASGATALDLSRLSLTALPPEFTQLSNLTSLNLSGNHLTALPPEFAQLANLTKLNLSDNDLTGLPPEFAQLANLSELSLSGNGLTALPPEITQLSNLTTLYLSRNRLTALPPEITQLSNLTTLYLSRNRLTALPPEITQLPNLTSLNLSNNGLTALPPEFGQLSNLTELYLCCNRLTTLPPEITQLPNLTELDLSGNRLTSLPPEFGHLTNLTELDLSDNRLTALPPEFAQLANLTSLSLSDNRLTALPPEFAHLPNLTLLSLSGNGLTALPPEITQLSNLTSLYLGGNSLTALPPEIGQLTNLTSLNLWSNRLTALPPEITQLSNLTKLNLCCNRLTALPPEIGQLTHLTALDLSFNHLTVLPPEITQLINLAKLDLRGNPLTLTLPRALVETEDAQAILRFYRAVWLDGRELGEARVLFVGQPGVGKTSLVHRLLDGSFDPNRQTTLTVETHALPLGNATARLWDFGGQEHMHATHPFFFSERCVYVLVLNVRQTYEQNRVAYWLRTIRAFGGDAPVIVVGNHADAEGHVLDLPQNRLRRAFPAIRAFLQTSAAEGEGIEGLRAALTEAVASLPHVRVQFAQTHLRVKAALEQERTYRDIIPYDRYRELCAAEGITDMEDQDTLLALLHDLGVVLDFRNEDGEPISPEGVLNPNWVTEAVYRIINDKALREQTQGKLTRNMVRRILPDYLPYQRGLILELLQRFELAYPADAETWYLPNAMPQDEPTEAADAAWEGALTFEYEYPELPESIITRFIVRTYEHIAAGQVWRWGVILHQGANRALVRADQAAKKISIRVTGQENTRHDLLAFIRGHFDAIHRRFAQSAGEDAFPVEAYLCPPQYPGLRLKYADLLTFEKNGRCEIPQVWQGRDIDINVTEILNGFVPPKERGKEETQMTDRPIYNITNNFNAPNAGPLTIGSHNHVQQTIQHSFNTPASPDLAPLLAELTQAVEAMLPHLPPEDAEEVHDDMERLQEELQKPKPRRKWYSVSIAGLQQAAQNLGEIGKPVLALAGRILTVLHAAGM